MTQRNVPFSFSVLAEEFSKAPREYQAFVVFAALVSLSIPLGHVFGYHTALIPYIGWSSSLFFYVFALIPALSFRLSGNSKQLFAIKSMLWLGVLIGIIRVVFHDSFYPEATSNPYLKYSVLQPLFTVVVPAAWAFLLGSKSVKNWSTSDS